MDKLNVWWCIANSEYYMLHQLPTRSLVLQDFKHQYPNAKDEPTIVPALQCDCCHGWLLPMSQGDRDTHKITAVMPNVAHRELCEGKHDNNNNFS